MAPKNARSGTTVQARTSRLPNRAVLSAANMTHIAAQRKTSCRLSVLRSSAPFAMETAGEKDATSLNARAAARGTRRTTAVSPSMDATSKPASRPVNSRTYRGSSTIWRARFKGSRVLLSSTFPLAMPVNTRYQSVQGVTSSIMIPVLASTDPGKNAVARTKARIGVQTKLITRAVERKRTSLNALLTLPTSTDRNTRNSITIRNGSMSAES